MSSEEKTPEQLTKEIEEDTMTPLRSRSGLFKKAFDIYDKQGNIKKREEMRWNIWVFDMRFLRKNEEEMGFPSKGFGSMIAWNDREGRKYFYPDPSQFPDKAFKYLTKKMGETKNPVHKARYADILWDQKQNYDAALVAVDAYISCADIYYKNFTEDPNRLHVPIEMVDTLSRAIKIAALISNWEFMEKVYSKDLEILEKLYSINKPRWYIEIMESIISVKDIERKCDLTQLEKYLQHGREEFLKLCNFHIMRTFIELTIGFYKKTGRETEIKKLQIDIGESFIKEAELRLWGENPSYLVAAIFYQQALEHFRNIGESTRLDELKLKIKQCYQKAGKKEFKRIQVRSVIKDEDIEKYFIPLRGLPLSDILLYIGLDLNLRPSYKKAKGSAKEQAKKFVLSSFANRVIVRNENPIRTSRSDEENLKEQTIWEFVMGYDVLSVILGMMFRKLRKDFGLTYESLTNYLCSRDFLKSESKFIKSALERYFAEDYTSFLHISVVRVESILRNFLMTLNIPTSKERDGIVEEKTLDKILETPELQYILGEDVIYFINVFLSSKEGTNLRHDVAHGLVDFESCDELRSNLIVYLWLIFATFRIEINKA